MYKERASKVSEIPTYSLALCLATGSNQYFSYNFLYLPVIKFFKNLYNFHADTPSV